MIIVNYTSPLQLLLMFLNLVTSLFFCFLFLVLTVIARSLHNHHHEDLIIFNLLICHRESCNIGRVRIEY